MAPVRISDASAWSGKLQSAAQVSIEGISPNMAFIYQERPQYGEIHSALCVLANYS